MKILRQFLGRDQQTTRKFAQAACVSLPEYCLIAGHDLVHPTNGTELLLCYHSQEGKANIGNEYLSDINGQTVHCNVPDVYVADTVYNTESGYQAVIKDQ